MTTVFLWAQPQLLNQHVSVDSGIFGLVRFPREPVVMNSGQVKWSLNTHLLKLNYFNEFVHISAVLSGFGVCFFLF